MNDFEPLPQSYLSDFNTNAPASPALKVTTDAVFQKLSALNPYKAHGADNIPNWILKENANLLSQPVSDILNCSYRECRLPQSWKEANVVPVPKQKPVKDVNKHLRPISLTPVLSKIAEDFVVEEFIKPAATAKIDNNQYGTVPKSSTTQALVSMVHAWSKHTDGNGATVRVVLFDFRKAFNLIDHAILAKKLENLDLPPGIMSWVIDFLKNRKQRVKLSQDCFSEWGAVPAGVSQGTKLGPWLFLVMIDDINADKLDLWKFVDDTTMAEAVQSDGNSKIQESVEDLVDQNLATKFQLNETKCKELRITFSKSDPILAPIVVSNQPLEIVKSAKLLGINISSDLKWNIHITEIMKKCTSRFYFVRQLKLAHLATSELLTFYLCCIRPVAEYGCQLFHNALPKYLSADLERIQKRALKIIHPELTYREALAVCNLPTLGERRQKLCDKRFNEVVSNPKHKLHNLLPSRNECQINLRAKRVFNINFNTLRFRNTFINSSALQYK